MMVGLNLIIKKTRWGKAMRAVAQNKTMAALAGINVNRVISYTFALAGALGGAAGIMVGAYYNTLYPTMGYVAGVKAFAQRCGATLPGWLVDAFEKATRDPIENEAANGLSNATGTIAMARTMAPHSATAQFFINVKDNDFLNHRGETPDAFGYAVFGKVMGDGQKVVDAIAQNDVMESVTVAEE